MNSGTRLHYLYPYHLNKAVLLPIDSGSSHLSKLII